jgi:glycosyltransferase involved in cell wall biosynthesis
MKFPHLPIVLDFRDEWLSTSFGVASFQFNRSERARRFAVEAEAKAVSSATAVVAVTDAARREIRSRYPNDPDSKFHHIPNGFDATRLPTSKNAPAPSNGERIIVTYVGSVYSSTEPTTFVQALQSLPAEVKSRFKVRFIGRIEEPGYRASLLGLGDMVELRGYVPQREALAAMNETDYALLISHDRLNVSAKFYDYIGACKPILGCVHPDGDIRKMLEQLRAGWWADSHDVEGIRQLFLDAAARGKAPFSDYQPDIEKIAQYERRVLAHRYADLLHSIAGRHKVLSQQEPVAEVSGRAG